MPPVPMPPVPMPPVPMPPVPMPFPGTSNAGDSRSRTRWTVAPIACSSSPTGDEGAAAQGRDGPGAASWVSRSPTPSSLGFPATGRDSSFGSELGGESTGPIPSSSAEPSTEPGTGSCSVSIAATGRPVSASGRVSTGSRETTRGAGSGSVCEESTPSGSRTPSGPMMKLVAASAGAGLEAGLETSSGVAVTVRSGSSTTEAAPGRPPTRSSGPATPAASLAARFFSSEISIAFARARVRSRSTSSEVLRAGSSS